MKKEKIGIITTQNQLNYGGVLQAFALSKKIEKLFPNSVVELVNVWLFIDNADLYGEPYSKLWQIWKRSVLKRLLIRLFLPQMCLHRKRRNNTLSFLRQYIHNSKTVYKRPQELFEKKNEFDIYVAGSDQIWRYQSRMHSFALLSGIKDKSVKKISYAASLGWSKLPQEYHEEYVGALMDFNAISVREPTAVGALTKLLNGKKNIEWCIDPTLLVGREFWIDFVKNTSAPIPKSDYAFVYWLADLGLLKEIFEGLCKRGIKKIVFVSPWYMKMLEGNMIEIEKFRNQVKKEYNAEWCISGGPLEFIHLLAKSKYVVANSFHAMMFSLIFSKKVRIFVDVKRQGDKMAPRMKDFAEKYDIQNVVVEGVKNNCDFDVDCELDYDKIWEKIDVDRFRSEDFLKHSIM